MQSLNDLLPATEQVQIAETMFSCEQAWLSYDTVQH